MNRFEKNHKWVVCPICKDEWTKLKPCLFIWDKRWQTDSMCIQCGETTKSLEKISARYPILGVTIKKGFIGPGVASSLIGGKLEREYLFRNQYALVNFGALTMGITASAYGPMSVKIGEEEPQTVDNILACWSIIRKAVDSYRSPGVRLSCMWFFL